MTYGPRRLSLRVLRSQRRQATPLPVVEDYDRPKTRAECPVERPCPFVSCKHHLYLDAMPDGALVLNFPDKEVDELEETCALDVAERGAHSLGEVGPLMNLVRERIRQIEMRALRLLRARGKGLG